jgi:hypothetical protein
MELPVSDEVVIGDLDVSFNPINEAVIKGGRQGRWEDEEERGSGTEGKEEGKKEAEKRKKKGLTMIASKGASTIT